MKVLLINSFITEAISEVSLANSYDSRGKRAFESQTYCSSSFKKGLVSEQVYCSHFASRNLIGSTGQKIEPQNHKRHRLFYVDGGSAALAANPAMSFLTARAWCNVAAHTAKMMMFHTTKKIDIPKMAPALRDLRGAPGYEDSMLLFVLNCGTTSCDACQSQVSSASQFKERAILNQYIIYINT